MPFPWVVDLMQSAADSSGVKWKVARSFPRFAIDIPFLLRPMMVEAMDPIPGRMVDIGLGGFCGVLSSEVNVRQKLVVEFRLTEDGESLQLKVIVRYHRDARFGFEFLEIHPEQRERIRHACQGLLII